jgi:hypothetical protein
MKCPKCNADNLDTSRFCGNCATSLASAKTAPPSLTETLESSVHLIPPGTVYAGRYEILGQLGAGGMGEVYRAVDRSLGRHVAIKVLPSAFAEDKERMARFEREAKLLAVLNHPNIASIHGLEESDGRRFLVLELAEGETLQARLNRGPLPVEEALETCRELAEGLEAAHEKGIIHRDLKPGNIMILPEGKVKILDFGLAKVYGGETTGVDIEKSPTITAKMTEPGVILGTAAYMSPEQVRGRAVDRRSDIWALGCVLYECLTGSRAFHGDTVSDTLAHILKGEPDWIRLPPETPPRIKVLLHRCLEKDPRKRLHDIADARLEIDAPEAYPSEAIFVPRRFSILWLGAGAVVMLLAGVLIDRVLIRHPQPAASLSVVTSTIKVEPGHWLDGMPYELQRPTRIALAIANDGKFVVYSAIEENPGPQSKPRLFLRRLDQSEGKPIAGTEGGINPFLSPDNRWVGFWADRKLKKVPVEGGVPIALCDASWLFGANWGRENSIVFSDLNSNGLSRISAEGGKPEILTNPDPKREEARHSLPILLPTAKAVLFTVMRHGWDEQPWLALYRTDTGEWSVLLRDAADARYVPTGHLVFLRQGTLMAVRFDLANQKVIGQPVPVVDNVMQAFALNSGWNTGAGQFCMSDSGSLIYATGGVIPELKNSLVWVNMKGIEEAASDLRRPFFAPRLSPDGQRVAYEGGPPIWVHDFERGTNSRLTDEGVATYPIWSPDGRRLLFWWLKSVVGNLFWQPYDGSQPMERLTTSEYEQFPGSWSSDGKTVALVEEHPDTGKDIYFLDVPSRRVTPFQNTKSSEAYPEFSPDGRWIAYSSDESNRREVYVRPYPGPGLKYLVSTEGGIQPLWARNGKQLFYRWGDQLWVADVRTDGGFSTNKPRLLFAKPGYLCESPIRDYDLSLDGQRFLMVKLEQRKPTPVTEMILVQNWFEELKRLVPTRKK